MCVYKLICPFDSSLLKKYYWIAVSSEFSTSLALKAWMNRYLQMLCGIDIKCIFAESGPKPVWEHEFLFSILPLIWLVTAIMIYFILCNQLLHSKWQLNNVLSNSWKNSVTVTFRRLKIILLLNTCFVLKLKCFGKAFFQTTCIVTDMMYHSKQYELFKNKKLILIYE